MEGASKRTLLISATILLANRIVAARNEDRLVDYEGASKTQHFSAFQGHHEKLVEKAEEVEELLLPALKEQRAIDAGKYLMTMEEWRDTLDQ
ncbi:hypothetical protein JG688_00018324 [Phytophthora aleatoria]|uniref:RxLR effector protein n=1 Tax=Phytophthora aleatoria TaxID=2496075 RepID=A0A8J5I261_9STRA|nr:hypothetical protein JG688_00018324 [Phytophthora aleatoria]